MLFLLSHALNLPGRVTAPARSEPVPAPGEAVCCGAVTGVLPGPRYGPVVLGQCLQNILNYTWTSPDGRADGRYG